MTSVVEVLLFSVLQAGRVLPQEAARGAYGDAVIEALVQGTLAPAALQGSELAHSAVVQASAPGPAHHPDTSGRTGRHPTLSCPHLTGADAPP